jgi:pyridoxal phosphate enzyme (YggS family)
MNKLADPSITSLHEHLDSIQQKIRLAAERSGRESSSVTLVAVTKTVQPNQILEVVQLGVRDLGENRIQEAALKREQLAPTVPVTYHLIGQLQRNKARKAVELFQVIQSLDRENLAGVLNRLGLERNKPVQVFIEVKLGNEPTKSGVPLDRAEEFLTAVRTLPGLRVQGLMTIAPLGITTDETRQTFKLAKTFFDKQKIHLGDNPHLSMGMSDDFELAIEEGSTMVRIGRALFGERKTHD